MSQPTSRASTIYESAYGRFQPPYLWASVALGVIGLIGVPIGIFANRGWEMGNRPLEPWAATVIIEIISLGALAVGVYALLLNWRRNNAPQRVAVTASELIVPKGPFSREELVLPFHEIEMKIFDVGFVKQLQIKHGRRRLLLTSALFPSNQDFDRLVDHLPE